MWGHPYGSGLSFQVMPGGAAIYLHILPSSAGNFPGTLIISYLHHILPRPDTSIWRSRDTFIF